VNKVSLEIECPNGLVWCWI